MTYRKTLLFSALIVSGIVTLTACTTAPMAPAAAPAPVAQAAAPAPSYPASIGQLVAKTKSQIKTVKMPEFKAAYDQKNLGMLIDVRNENEFEDGYIQNLPFISQALKNGCQSMYSRSSARS